MGLLLKVCVELGLEKRSKSQKTRYERERERERMGLIVLLVEIHQREELSSK